MASEEEARESTASRLALTEDDKQRILDIATEAVEQRLTRNADDLVKKIGASLKGHPPAVQGAALGMTVAYWIAMHNPKLRDTVFPHWIEFVKSYIPLAVDELFGDEGFPQEDA